MLILCYGITKSGSTLAFELIKGMLKSAGFEQRRLPDAVVTPGHRVNFVERMDPATIAKLYGAMEPNEKIAVKVHCKVHRPTFIHLQELQAQRKLQIFASYRDPREISLSMIDAGAKAREANQQAFSEFKDVDSTLSEIERQLEIFRRWAAIRGTVRLGYNMVAFEPDTMIDIVERVLGIAVNRGVAKHHAFNRAFTQKNKGVKDRLNELSPDDRQRLTARFQDFIDNVIVNNNEAWFSDFRQEFSRPERAEAPR